MTGTPELFGGAEYVALTTFLAGGAPVTTPVWVARLGRPRRDGGRAVVVEIRLDAG